MCFSTLRCKINISRTANIDVIEYDKPLWENCQEGREMSMANAEIRELIRKKRLRHYEIAEELGVNEFTFSRWLRNELPDEKKQEIIEAIEQIKF